MLKRNRNNQGGHQGNNSRGGYQGNNNDGGYHGNNRGGHRGNNSRGGNQGNNNRGHQGNNNRGGYQGNNNSNNHGTSQNGNGPFWRDDVSRERVKKILADHGYTVSGQTIEGGNAGVNRQGQSYVAQYWSNYWRNHYESEFETHKANFASTLNGALNNDGERSTNEETLVNDNGDDFLEHFIHKAERMNTNYHADRLLTEGEREQDAILRFQFCSAEPINVSANLVNGRFRIATAWGSLSQQNSLLAHAAHYFYSRNTFRINTIEDLKSFTRNLPESSRHSMRHTMLMSSIVRRRPQRAHLNDRTKEDVEVAECLARFPNTVQLTFFLGWDISDAAHRQIIGEWAHISKNCVQVNVHRSDEETVIPSVLYNVNATAQTATDELEFRAINERLLSRYRDNTLMET